MFRFVISFSFGDILGNRVGAVSPPNGARVKTVFKIYIVKQMCFDTSTILEQVLNHYGNVC